ncbi:AAA family ATPase [Lactococcus lactis]|uniref:AAA family ATPase n=1 Tax=Lactococcus lactis TaxID=1358 RepID=UPI001F5B94BB|nr:AAA family ATPase [Lactococcus lactis]
MSGTADKQKKEFSLWAKENLGEKVGIWYAPYIEKFGTLLRKFDLDAEKDYYTNFFFYTSFDEFKDIYKQVIGQSDDEIAEIIKGKQLRYPEKYAQQKLQWSKGYAQMTYNNGERNKPDNYGGIADLGPLFRAYLKFLYYAENPSLTYPKKEKKTTTHDGEIDDSINYWLYAPGDDARFFEEFYTENVMGLGWDYLGNLSRYSTRSEVEKVIADNRIDERRPTNDSKAVWDFYKEIKPGDIVYAKAGIKKIVGRGIVTGEYYFDNEVDEYKHRHTINWTNKGSWELKEKVAQKTLTNFNDYPDWIVYVEQLISGNIVEENSLLVNEFKTWLSQQVQQNGEYLNDKSITQKVASLKDIEKHFKVIVFGETDTEALKNIKETILADESYDRYKGVSGSSLDYYIRYIESKPVIEENEPYSQADFLSEVFIDETKLQTLQSVLQNKKNLILKGAPGVGKTFIADRLAFLMMGEKDETRIQMIQFHQSYSYEDFIEGYRPKADGEGFELKQGPFVKFARKATRDPERDYFFIIDEINRGNMSKIFGELMMLIESDKRGKSINLLYSNEKFSVPDNLYIIGMMNTADRSLALLDYALRRRFSFFEISPAFENYTFKNYINSLVSAEKLLRVIDTIKELNITVSDELGTGFQIGHSYFVGEAFEVNADKRVKEVVEFEIIPQLYEYWFDDESKAEEWANRLIGVVNGI